MEIKKDRLIGAGVGVFFFLLSLIFMNKVTILFLFIGLGIISFVSPFVFGVIYQNKVNESKEDMFLEFSRNLVESVKAGTPINKSILNVKDKNYGVLSPHIRKLADQISMGIPLSSALKTFALDIDNKTISRSLTLIGQAEKAGGEIGMILESVVEAVAMSDKLKKERKASISTLVVQGYIIFFVFITIVLVMQFKILPLISGITGLEGGVLGGASGEQLSSQDISNAFLALLLIQGFFNGLTIGKLSSGSMKAGVKHSFGLMISSFLIATIANIVFGV